MFRFNRFDKYRWNKKYPEGYADLCEFIWFYNGLSHNEDSILHRYHKPSFHLQGADKNWTVISLEQERSLDKLLKFMADHPESRKTAYIEYPTSKEKGTQFTKEFRKMNIDYKKAYKLNIYITNQIISALDEALEKQYM
jgi:hypothetical protein